MTFIIILSGKGEPYRVCNQLNQRSCDDDTLEELIDRDSAVPGTFNNAWMYDGNQWNDLPDMSTPRDRPSCSLVESDNGEVSYRKNMIGAQSSNFVKKNLEGSNAGNKNKLIVKISGTTENFRQARSP